MQAVELLKEGVIWRVGNGQQINIWDDPWLPRDMTRKPISPKGRSLIQRVDELIDPISEQWDVQLLSQTFWEEDIKLICSLPLHMEMDDIVGWHFDSKGRFLVCSAYKVHQSVMAREAQRGRLGNAESSQGKDRFLEENLEHRLSSENQALLVEIKPQYTCCWKSFAKERDEA